MLLKIFLIFAVYLLFRTIYKVYRFRKMVMGSMRNQMGQQKAQRETDRGSSDDVEVEYEILSKDDEQ